MFNLKPLLLIGAIASFPLLSVPLANKVGAVDISQVMCPEKGQSIDQWQEVQDIFCRKRRDGSSQGDAFCSLSPYNAFVAYRIWRDHPLFIWKGPATRIEIRNSSDEAPFWSRDLAEEEQSVLYDGPKLHYGQPYIYSISYKDKNNYGDPTTDSKTIRFKVMKEEKRQLIKNKLQEQGLYLDQQGDMSPEEFALRRAVFFAQEDLFLDVVAELFSVTEPSPEWVSKTQELRTNFCE